MPTEFLKGVKTLKLNIEALRKKVCLLINEKALKKMKNNGKITGLEVVEFHSHSDALAPDHGERVSFSSGTFVSYNNVDYRFINTTDQAVQLCLWCDDEKFFDKAIGETIDRVLVLDNHSEVMFDYSQIPKNLILMTAE